jgi:acyl carrier protein
MDLNKVMDTLIEVLREIQEDSGRPIPENINQDTRPFSDFSGFDSLNCVEASADLSKRLGCTIEYDVFFSEAKRQYLTIGEIAVRIVKVINPAGGTQ